MNHYQAVKAAKDGDLMPIAVAISYYLDQAADGVRDLAPVGRLWDTAKKLPGMMAYRYTQLQEIEAILQHIELVADKKQIDHKRRIMETSSRAWSERFAGDQAEVQDDVYALRLLQNEVSMVRNTFLGLTKGIEQLHFQMSNLVKLRDGGIEDATF